MHFVTLTQFAETAAPAKSGNVLEALGIDWQMFVFQIIGFVILVWLMGKFVYPILMKQVDQRQAAIEESNRAAVEASKQAEKSKVEVDALLKQARTEARDIVATAKEEADAMVATAESKSKVQSERIIAAAQDEIAKEVVAAKKALHNETIDLVAMATEKVLGNVVDVKTDSKLIAKAVEESK